MRRIAPLALVALVAVLLLALLLPGAGAPPAGGPAGPARVSQVDTSAYPEVTLYLSVLDAAGAPRDDLSAADFAVSEDGAPVEVRAFSGAGSGQISAALVIDRSGSMADEAKIDGARAAALAFVDLLRPGDQAALIAFNDEVRTVEPLGADVADLRDSIDRLRPDNGTALYDALVAGVDLLREAPGRRVLLVLADGQDCSAPSDGCPDEAGSARSLAEALAYAAAAGQPVAVVGVGQRGGDGIDETTLQRIAAETGGQYFYAPRGADLADLFADISLTAQQEYRLTYLSPRPFYDGTRRDIAVLVDGALATGGYTERHLINVVASPWVGLLLLTPLVGLLLLPGALARRRRTAAPAPAAPALPTSAGAATIQAPAAAAPAARVCAGCGAPLRPGARFCSRCGAAQ